MAGPSRPKRDSFAAVLHAILAAGASNTTNAELATRADLSPRSVDNVLRYLRDRDLVRTSPVRLGPGWGLVLSISLGAASCRAGLVDANGTVVYEQAEPWLPDQTKQPPDELLERIVTAGRKVVEMAYRQGDLLIDGRLRILGVATAWPCPVRGSKRAVGSILHPGWLTHDPPKLTDAVADAFGIDRSRSHALNRGNAHALALAFDAARARSDVHDRSAVAFYLRLGGGIGFSTMILNPGKAGRLPFIDSILIGGARGMAGQLAHLEVSPSLVEELNERGRHCSGLAPLSLDWPCSCGQFGHLEALAGGAAFLERMNASGVGLPKEMAVATNDLTDVLGAFDLRDERVRYALEDMGRLVGRALVAPVLVLDPRVLTLSGSFAVPLVIQGVRAERETWRRSFGDNLTISDVGGGESAYLGVRGAALAVHRALVYRKFENLLAADPPAEGLTMDWPDPAALVGTTH